MSTLALAFDLGGTELRGALVGHGGEVVAHVSEATLSGAGSEAVIGQIITLADKLLKEHPQARVVGIGACAPGPLDPKAGIVIGPPTLAGWHNVPMIDILSRQFGLPVRLENDANAAALGEWRFGAGRGAASMVFVTVSTGIGGGVIADGHIYHGRRGLAAEIGHMTITCEGDRCFCGNVGCFEAACGHQDVSHECREEGIDIVPGKGGKPHVKVIAHDDRRAAEYDKSILMVFRHITRADT